MLILNADNGGARRSDAARRAGARVHDGAAYVNKIKLRDTMHFAHASAPAVVEMYGTAILDMRDQGRVDRSRAVPAPGVDAQDTLPSPYPPDSESEREWPDTDVDVDHVPPLETDADAEREDTGGQEGSKWGKGGGRIGKINGVQLERRCGPSIGVCKESS